MTNNEHRPGVIQLQRSDIQREATKRVLVLYEEKINVLGDACIRFGKLKYFKSFLSEAMIDLNFTVHENTKFSDAFLKCNPNVNSVTMLSWDEIDFHTYDIVFCAKYDEAELLEYLLDRHGPEIITGHLKPRLLSLSQLLLPPRDTSSVAFPQSDQLARYVNGAKRGAHPGELYLCREEQVWADCWLESQGLRSNEDLFILCDSASSKDKLLNVFDYFEVLKYLLNGSDSKILIFDEQGVGKRSFYEAWLDSNSFKRLIISERLSLRQDLCLIGSRHTKFVFGPCTGLMHCSSSIYNGYVNGGSSVQEVPPIVVYTGKYLDKGQNADSWWGDCPLVECLLLKKRDGKKQVVSLNNLTEEERNCDDSLPCGEYTAELLSPIIEACLTRTTRSSGRT